MTWLTRRTEQRRKERTKSEPHAHRRQPTEPSDQQGRAREQLYLDTQRPANDDFQSLRTNERNLTTQPPFTWERKRLTWSKDPIEPTPVERDPLPNLFQPSTLKVHVAPLSSTVPSTPCHAAGHSECSTTFPSTSTDAQANRAKEYSNMLLTFHTLFEDSRSPHLVWRNSSVRCTVREMSVR